MANQIHPMAVVDPEAKLGDNNIIGPFCVIDKNVIIGNNNKFLNNVTVHFGARIGNGNEFFPGSSISTKPQDLKFQGEETTCEIGDNNSIRENVTISRGTASKGKTVVGNGNLLMENMLSFPPLAFSISSSVWAATLCSKVDHVPHRIFHLMLLLARNQSAMQVLTSSDCVVADSLMRLLRQFMTPTVLSMQKVY